MKKLPHKFQIPLTVAIMLPIMLTAMPAVMLYSTLPKGAALFEPWLDTVTRMVPFALPTLLVIAGSIRFVVTKWLVQPAPSL
ncbi:hypothetical protein [Paraglaciecola polaris]|uniref:Uncharacterized protein n=1 Tax=Paraglaciecola polaris LMG 21857 TaxID=1129793 RepID=K6ZC03_9ALTE|nr:hypothetical protein [Paraglaciecola polaris]GAC33636.1 hypothetical protein GPLA_2742 [Paraglaciecola polaris LMG 21857]|tara:strand:- start:7646 stop:7891 length:246 start_codon:yes stop_codon:yes gene_type:complete